MRKPTKVIGILLGAVLILSGVRVVAVLLELNAFREINPHFAGSCVTLSGVTGAEDVEIDHEAGIAYVSATDRGAMSSGSPGSESSDGIYLLRLAKAFDPDAAFDRLPVDGLTDFHPHGIHVRRLDDGGARLFAVNHSAAGDSVEIFDVADGRLVHLETIRDPLIVSPNDLVSVDTRAFYVTNDRDIPYAARSRTFWGQIRFILIPRSLTNVVFSSGEGIAIAADSLDGANGIAASADASEIYITEALGKKLRIYERDSRNALHLKETIFLGSSPDNVSVAPDGKLLIAAKPSIFKMLIARSRRPPRPAPSQVLEVDPALPGDSASSEIYVNGGEEISAITVSAPFVTAGGEKAFIMGNAFHDRVVVCARLRK